MLPYSAHHLLLCRSPASTNAGNRTGIELQRHLRSITGQAVRTKKMIGLYSGVPAAAASVVVGSAMVDFALQAAASLHC